MALPVENGMLLLLLFSCGCWIFFFFILLLFGCVICALGGAGELAPANL